MSDHGIEWKKESKMLFSDGTLLRIRLHYPINSMLISLKKNDMIFPVAYTVLPS